MFYSYDILSRRSSGLSTVWLIATLGSKSSLKRVHRKDILSVSIPEACNLIIHPPQPLALRLSSSLLYGVTSIYDQQSGFLYSDVTIAYTKLKRVMYNIPGERSQNLNVTALPNKYIELVNDTGICRRLMLIFLRLRHDAYVMVDDPSFSIEFGLLPPLPIDVRNSLASSSNEFAANLNSLDLADFSLGYMTASDQTVIYDYSITLHSDQLQLSESFSAGFGYDDDAGQVSFEFGPHGDIVDFGLPIVERDDANAVARKGKPDDTVVSIDDYDNYERDQAPFDEDNGLPIVFDYDDANYRVVERAASVDILDQKHALDDEDADKSIKVKKQRVSRAMRHDSTTQLPIAKLRESRESYMSDMIEAKAIRFKKEEDAFVRAYASDYFVYNGALVGVLNDAFGTRNRLLERKTAGVMRGNIYEPMDDDVMPEIDMARLRFGGVDDGYDEVIMKDDEEAPVFDDVEMARRLSSDQNLPIGSSSLLPWNVPSAGASSTFGSRQHSVAPGSSLNFSSPRRQSLRQRGQRTSTMSFALERLNSFNEDDYDLPPPDAPELQDDANIGAQYSTLEHDSRNFFDYVMMKMDTLGTNILTFDNILDTQDCTAAVAAQGLMHVLALAGASVLSVHQRLSYGPIDVRLAPNVG
ncbi:Rec8 like protein-domain-containing protein [Lipomyces chichibuensis]|uniref:Rec8 like protein-domain-containing protein n=1 Tax=Lipomyces chichibuensis TaxID=1546026 RepID=UPI0033436A1F